VGCEGKTLSIFFWRSLGWWGYLWGMSPMQGQFNFESESAEDGHAVWLAGRRVLANAVARRLGLPLGRHVEVWLVGGVRLRGVLRLKEDKLFIQEDEVRRLELMVDRVGFTYREVESCIRTD